MGKVDVYIGGYLPIDGITKEESDRLASNGCVIGMPLELVYDAEASKFRVLLPNGDSLGTVSPSGRLAIREAIEEGWTRFCWLSLVYYDSASKAYGGEVVFQMFNVKPSQTKEQANLEAFARHTSERLAAGKRPDVALTGDSWDQVVETGDWATDAQEPLPLDTQRGGGKVVFKRRRSLADKMAMGLIDRKPGCLASVVAAALVVVMVILLALWRCSAGA